jgi:hypothetical protein
VIVVYRQRVHRTEVLRPDIETRRGVLWAYGPRAGQGWVLPGGMPGPVRTADVVVVCLTCFWVRPDGAMCCVERTQATGSPAWPSPSPVTPR